MAEPAKTTDSAKGKETARASAQVPQETAQKKKKDFLTFVTLGLVVLNLAILAGMGFFLSKMLGQIKEIKETPPVVAAPADLEEALVGKEYEPKELGTLFPLEGFLVNLASAEGPKFLQVQMELELEDPGVEEELSRARAAVRDAIIVLLSSRNFRELRQPNGIRKLRKDLVTTVQGLIKTEQSETFTLHSFTLTNR